MRRFCALALLSLATPAHAEIVGQDAAACAVSAGPAILATLTGLRDRKGTVKLELYPPNADDFLKDDRDLIAEHKLFRRIEVSVPANGPVQLCIRVPRAGGYALFAGHDRDGRNKFNFFTDGAGFPSNRKLGMSRPKLAEGADPGRYRRHRDDDPHAISARAQRLFPRQARLSAAMRIVDVNEFYSPTGGGVRTYVDRKMTLLANRGHELIVIAPGREDRVEERPGGGRIVYVRSPGMPFDRNYGLFWDAAAGIHALLDEYDPDVIENCSPWRPAWIVVDWSGRAAKSFFVHNDNVEAYAKRWFSGVASGERIERAFAWYDRYQTRFLDRFDTVVTNGPAMTDRLRGARRARRCDDDAGD